MLVVSFYTLRKHQKIRFFVIFWKRPVAWNGLTHLMRVISFDTPWKPQKTRGFLMFSGGIKRDQWHEMGQLNNCLTELKQLNILPLFFSRMGGFYEILWIFMFSHIQRLNKILQGIFFSNSVTEKKTSK